MVPELYHMYFIAALGTMTLRWYGHEPRSPAFDMFKEGGKAASSMVSKREYISPRFRFTL